MVEKLPSRVGNIPGVAEGLLNNGWLTPEELQPVLEGTYVVPAKPFVEFQPLPSDNVPPFVRNIHYQTRRKTPLVMVHVAAERQRMRDQGSDPREVSRDALNGSVQAALDRLPPEELARQHDILQNPDRLGRRRLLTELIRKTQQEAPLASGVETDLADPELEQDILIGKTRGLLTMARTTLKSSSALNSALIEAELDPDLFWDNETAHDAIQERNPSIVFKSGKGSYKLMYTNTDQVEGLTLERLIIPESVSGIEEERVLVPEEEIRLVLGKDKGEEGVFARVFYHNYQFDSLMRPIFDNSESTVNAVRNFLKVAELGESDITLGESSQGSDNVAA